MLCRCWGCLSEVLPACPETQKTETPELASISCHFLYNSLQQSSAASETKMVSLLMVTDGVLFPHELAKSF